MRRTEVLLVAVLAVALAACGKKSASGAVCGDGRADLGEECDGEDLAGASCDALGLQSGALGCHEDCTYDVTACTGTSECGNAVREYPEECDATDLAGQTCEGLGFDGGTLGCNAACTFDTSDCEVEIVCGDGAVSGWEECDGANLDGESCASLGLGGGELACGGDCLFDVSGCTEQAECGNDSHEYPEQCDGADLAGQDCETLGFDTGTLGCAADCTFDTSGCEDLPVCGDGVAEGAEQCDGADLAGQDCTTRGFDAGTLGCAGDCTYDESACETLPQCGDGVAEGAEVCDGSDLLGEDCLGLGFVGGDLGCAGDCTYDTSACLSCGNGTVDGGESCDGSDLGGQDCASQGFAGGTLGCAGDCTFDTSLCTMCGNDTVDGSELCDGIDLAGQACTDHGFAGGTLGCAGDCTFDTSLCTMCGNGAIDAGEQCDGGDLGGETCVTQGYAAGTLACSGACTFDVTACTMCGNGTLDAGEQCDGGDLGGETCVSQGFDGGTLGCTVGCAFDTGACVDCTGNQPPVADAGLPVSAPAGAPVTLNGTGSSDPENDALSYLWTPGVGAPALDDPTSPTPTFTGGTCNSVYTYTLVVNDGCSDSPPDQVTVSMTGVGPFVSVDGCVPNDECGDVDRPWCTIQGGVEAARSNGFPTVYVEEGTYVQGTGGVAVSETLVIGPGIAAGDPEVRGGYTDRYTLARAAGPSCDPATPGATIVEVSTAQGILFQNGTTSLFERFCVLSSSGSMVIPTRKANLTIDDSSPHLLGNLVGASYGGPIDTTIGIDIASSAGPIQPIIELNGDDVAAGIVFGGDGTTAGVGVAVTGHVELQLLENSFSGGLGGATTAAVAFHGQGSLIATENTLDGGDGSSASRGVYAERTAGSLTATLTSNTVTGGASTGVATGVGFVGLDTVLVTDNNVLHGRMANSGTLAFGLDLDDVADAEVSSDNVVRGGVTGGTAVGIRARNGTALQVLDANEVSGGIDGTGVGATALLQGIFADLAVSVLVQQNTLISGSMIDPATGDPYVGGRATYGIHVSSVPAVTIDANQDILGGGVPMGLNPGSAVPQSIGIRAVGSDQLAVTANTRIQGCTPHCGPGNSNPTPVPRFANGIGVLVSGHDTTGSGAKTISGNTLILGGPLLSASSSLGMSTVSVGIDVQERSNTSGLWVSISGNAEIAGNTLEDDPPTIHRPERAWGIRVYHAGVDVSQNPWIRGGRAYVEAVGINVEQTADLATTVMAADNGEIVGNPFRDDSAFDPGSVYGIRFLADPASGSSNLFVNGTVGALQQIGGGYARENMQGTAVGLRAEDVGQAWLSHNRLWGGLVPGGLVQRGVWLEDCATECAVHNSLIEACGVASGGVHDPRCEEMWARSQGLYVTDGVQMPTLVWNNLVFGGFSQMGSTGVAVRDSGLPTANVQVYNNYVNAQGQLHATCPAAFGGEAHAIELWPTNTGIGSLGAGLLFLNNIIDAGGRSCARYGVYEMSGGAMLDFTGLVFRHNVWVQAIGDRDNNPAGAVTWGYHEASGTDWCDASDATVAIDPTPPVGVTSCLNDPNAPTTATQHTMNRQGDPELAGSDVAISEAPWAVYLNDPTDLRATAAVLQANGTMSGMMIPPADDFEGDPRPDATVCDVGHDETPP